MKDAESIQIRLLDEGDPASIAATFQHMGWNKPEGQYRRYLHKQAAGTRTCFVATVDGQFGGYVTVNWRPTYAGFADLNIPEIQDLNVLAIFRRKGIASRLLDRAESEAAQHSAVVGFGKSYFKLASNRSHVKNRFAKLARGLIPAREGIFCSMQQPYFRSAQIMATREKGKDRSSVAGWAIRT